MISDKEIEQEIASKNLTAPHVSMDDILDSIEREQYLKVPGTAITICLLHMKNGYRVIGESAAVSLENFDKDLGEKIAKQKALDKCWPLFGFALADRIYRST